MILVTVGNPTQPFPRLLGAIQSLAQSGAFGGEPVTVQYGHSSCPTGPGIHPVQFLSGDDFLNTLNECRVVICHAGAGTLMQVLRLAKRPVVIPRLKRHGEHVDDHQLELARSLAQQGRIILAEDPSELPAALSRAASDPPLCFRSDAAALASLVKRALFEVVQQRGRTLKSS